MPSRSFDRMSWAEIRDVHGVATEGGRQVLGWALSILALLWTAYAAWSAGRSLATEPLTSPQIAQWVAILAGPLALMGLVWLMFGRTRRKEAEKFTRSVITMRTEARALQDVLAALQQQIAENHRSLGVMAGDLMGLGDQAATPAGHDHRATQRRFADAGRTWRRARSRRGSGADRHRRAAVRPAPGGGQRPADGRDAARSRPLRNRAGRPVRSPGRSACGPGPAGRLRSSTRRRERLLANLSQIESAGSRRRGQRFRGRRGDTAQRRAAAGPFGRGADRNPDRASTPRRRRCPRWSRRARPASAAPGSTRPSCSASGWPSAGAALDGLTRPDRRTGARLAAADGRSRHWASRRSTSGSWTLPARATSGPAMSRPRSTGCARELEELSATTSAQDFEPRRACRPHCSGSARALDELGMALSRPDERDARRSRSRRRPPAGFGRSRAAAYRADARRGDRGREPDRIRRVQRRGPAGAAGRADDLGRPRCRPGRAAADRTQRRDRRRQRGSRPAVERNRPGAGHGAGPGARSRGACRRAGPRGDRQGHSGKRRQSERSHPQGAREGGARQRREPSWSSWTGSRPTRSKPPARRRTG